MLGTRDNAGHTWKGCAQCPAALRPSRHDFVTTSHLSCSYAICCTERKGNRVGPGLGFRFRVQSRHRTTLHQYSPVINRYGSAFDRAPRNCTALGWCTLRSVSISDLKSARAISDDCFSDLTATRVPFHIALCTMPNSPSPALVAQQSAATACGHYREAVTYSVPIPAMLITSLLALGYGKV